MITMPETLPCPFCGADAEAPWIADEKLGKCFCVRCSRDGECPSPNWMEDARGHESDQELVDSCVTFWNTRAVDWSDDGWQSFQGPKPKVPVLVFTVPTATERRAMKALGDQAPEYWPYAIARWRKGKWRDVRDGQIYLVRAWKHLNKPSFASQWGYE